MEPPLVSVCMHVYNGEKYLAQTIDSLLGQDYKNIELIILDNQSTDSTLPICQSYSQKDSRLRLIVDAVRVGVPEAQNRIAQYARGEYFMVVCDDDIYSPDYISSLMRAFDLGPEIGLVYSSYDWIDEKGAYLRKGKTIFFKYKNSKFFNFLTYLRTRSVVPMIFGIFKTAIFRKALPFITVTQNSLWDSDNVFMFRVVSMTKIHSLEKVLFHYRFKDRSHTFPKDYPKAGIQRFFYLVRHQGRVMAHVYRTINNASFHWFEKILIRAYVILIFLYYCFILPGVIGLKSCHILALSFHQIRKN